MRLARPTSARPSCSLLADPITFPMAMPLPISWSELTSASVGLWGLGVEGTASLHRLEINGTVPVLVDDRATVEALDGLEVLPTERGGLRALLACDIVIKSPGIS